MPIIDPNKDYYAILDIHPTARDEEIRRIYRELVRLHHPDSGGDARRFRELQEAYEILRDINLRRSYDQQRSARGLSKTLPVVLDLLQSRENCPVLEAAQVLYIMLDIRPQKGLKSSRQRLNLALVIDRSSSMRGTRMQNVKMAAADLVESLHPDDRLALITFSDRAQVLTPSTLASEKRVFSSAIASMMPGGGTEIYQGLQAGIEEVRNNASDEKINHVILLTDGRTYGDEELALVEARRAGSQSIGISAFGIGEDWNDVFLDDLARYGGGVSKYISTSKQVREVLQGQIQGLSNILMRNMRLKVNLASYAKINAAYRVLPYMEALHISEEGDFDLGSLISEEPGVVVLELLIDQKDTGTRRVARIDLEAVEVSALQRIHLHQDVKVNFKLGTVTPEVPARLLNFLTRLSIFRLQEKAWKALESGNTKQATHFLEAAATRLFDIGYQELGQAAMLEVGRLSQGGDPTGVGRKKLRYGTRSLSIPTE